MTMPAAIRKPALWIVEEDGSELKLSFEELSRRSSQVANFLRRQGVRRGDRVIVMLPNVAGIWEVMLAGLKLGAILIPAATLLTEADLRDRLDRGKARHVIAIHSCCRALRGHRGKLHANRLRRRRARLDRLRGGLQRAGRIRRRRAHQCLRPFSALFHLRHHGASQAGAAHSPELSRRASRHHVLDRAAARRCALQHQLARLGQARLEQLFRAMECGRNHLRHNYARFEAKQLLRQIERCGVTSLCAPPTVWRMLVLGDLQAYQVKLRDAGQRGRAAQSGGYREGPRGLGHHHPRRLRPDGERAHPGKLPRAEGQAGGGGQGLARAQGRSARCRRDTKQATAKSASSSTRAR